MSNFFFVFIVIIVFISILKNENQIMFSGVPENLFFVGKFS